MTVQLPFPRVEMPTSDAHGIALVGCGGIGRLQLDAYRKVGWNVVVLCDAVIASAESARDEYFPDTDATDDFDAVLARTDVTVVDLAVHTDIRPGMVRKAILAGKHVMSQKPFVETLAEGRALAELAEEHGVTLAVNQNGRWSPHFHALRAIVESGRLGQLVAADFAAYWPHDIHTEHHRLGQDPNLVLYDYAIHWFDLVACLFPEREAVSVYATTARRRGQLVPVPTIASVIIDFGDAQVSILMRASARHEDTGSYHVVGTEGAAVLHGGALGGQRVDIVAEEPAHIETVGNWFPDALIGSMAELLRAIENGTKPATHPRSSLAGLALCFAAIESAATGATVVPADVAGLYREGDAA
jgi:predicted dehydrogenase